MTVSTKCPPLLQLPADCEGPGSSGTRERTCKLRKPARYSVFTASAHRQKVRRGSPLPCSSSWIPWYKSQGPAPSILHSPCSTLLTLPPTTSPAHCSSTFYSLEAEAQATCPGTTDRECQRNSPSLVALL